MSSFGLDAKSRHRKKTRQGCGRGTKLRKHTSSKSGYTRKYRGQGNRKRST